MTRLALLECYPGRAPTEEQHHSSSASSASSARSRFLGSLVVVVATLRLGLVRVLHAEPPRGVDPRHRLR